MTETDTTPCVLFLCTHNAARSQMAEAFLRHYAADRFEVLSAGLAPTQVHPLTRQVWSAIIESPRLKEADAQTTLAECRAKHRWTTRLSAATIARYDFPALGGSSPMSSIWLFLRHVMHVAYTLVMLLVDTARFLRLSLRSPTALTAENLFLRKQLALYQERHVKPQRATNATRLTLVWLSHWFDWRQGLAVVQPATFIRWHRQGFRLFWRWKSTPGRPPIPVDLQALIRRMARENPTWGQERIANELLLKLGLQVSPRTVRKYMPRCVDHGRGQRMSSQRWRTFVRNHAQAIVACDFCVVVTATFRLLYVFVVMEHATRRIMHTNVTAHPTAAWTLQQLREAIPADHTYRFLIHDRDSIFSHQLDQGIRHLGLQVLKTPVRTPQANALCERLIGTLRRECLDFVIPFTEHHLQRIVQAWVLHYNGGRPHMALGPGIPEPLPPLPVVLQVHRHHLPEHLRVVARPILGGLHHAYALEAKAA